MKPSHIVPALEVLINARQPAFLWGPPGVGKSQLVAQLARRCKLQLVDVRAVLLDPVDLRGLPRIDEHNEARWCAPSFLPKSGRGILFLDELNTAPPLVQAACYQLILDRRLGDYELPDGWAVLAAGNRESDRSVTHRMPSALANRLAHIDVEPDVSDWLHWAGTHGIAPEIMAFLRFRPNLLHVFDPTRSEKAFPSPRSWEFASRVLQADPGRAVAHTLLPGIVGEGAAAECVGFLRIMEQLPDTKALLADPHGVELPAEPASIYALCENVARHAGPDTMPSLSALASRLPTEFGVLLMRSAAAAEPSIVQSEAFQGWACANSDVLV